MTVDERTVVMGAAAKFGARLEELGRSQDAELMGSLFRRQGLKQTPVSPTFASEFFQLARAARNSLRDRVIPGELIDRVTGWVADYRAEYSRPRTN